MILLLSGGIFEGVQAENIPNPESKGYIKKRTITRKPLQPKTEEINYELLVKDIIQIFRWMEEPNITSVKLLNRISKGKYKHDNNDIAYRFAISPKNIKKNN